MCGLLFWGFWWIVPLIGFAMCIAFMAFRALGARGGFMCMGGRHTTPTITSQNADGKP